MTKEWSIEKVNAGVVRPLRAKVLRPGLPPSEAVFEGDDAVETVHLALRVDGEVVGVLSLFPRDVENNPSETGFQLRGMATQPQFRGKGLGTQLLLEAATLAKESGATSIWCNARTVALPFYSKHGFEVVGAEFDIPGVGPHYRAVLDLR
ncbi:MAG TPA: GNAT family N-acetyltransferase [Cryomorphaceae bacterium]|nr:GNAT family N-acetyltransferase [Cryomorphaceae bacterium]